MTTTRAPRRLKNCTDCRRKLTAENTRHYVMPDFCDDCMEIAGIENNHQDGYHESDQEGPHPDCPMCGNAIKDRSRKGHAGTTVARGSHAECYAKRLHAKDKAGRAACRAKKS